MQKGKKLKKIIAREWLILILFFFLSPAVLGTYSWISTPKQYNEGIPAYHYPHIYDKIFTLRKALNKENKIPPGAVLPEESEDLKVAITKFRKGKILVLYKKRPLGDYLTDIMTDIDKYLAVLFIYPFYLFICSIVWALRTMSRRES